MDEAETDERRGNASETSRDEYKCEYSRSDRLGVSRFDVGVSMVHLSIPLVHDSSIQYNHSNTGTKASEKLWKTLRIMIGTSNSNPRVRGILKNAMLSIQRTVQICIIIRSRVRVTLTETEIAERRIVIVETMYLVDFTSGIIRVPLS